MNHFILSCCSTADLTLEQLQSIKVEHICFHYELNGVEYADDMGQSMSFKDFYHAMAKGASTKTSQVNADEYEAYFKTFLDKGYDILHVSLSSGLSGTINSANIAKDMLASQYPERKIYVVDSLAASAGYGLIMDTLATMRDNGNSIDDLYNWINTNKLQLNHYFFSTDLSAYIRGGRISKTEGLIGNLLNICPLLRVNSEGKLVSKAKVRGKRKVVQAIVDEMIEHAKDGLNYSGKCFITHSECLEDATAVANLIEEKFPNLDGKVNINYIGTTIGSHTGPNTVALFFWGNARND